jgi:hypothetical protein
MTYPGPAFAARADRAIATTNGIGSGAPPNRSSDQPLAEAIGQSSRAAQRKQG